MLASPQPHDKKPQLVDAPEIKLLLCCARTVVNQEQVCKIKALIQSQLDWNRLLLTAANQGVMPLLAYNLANICPDIVPQKVLAQLQNYLQGNAINNLGLNRQLIDILQLLELKTIAAVPFKGIVLATSVYQNPLLRDISDLDILVHSADFLKAKNLLIAQGYKLRNEVPWECHLVKDNGVNIDLHLEIIPQHLVYPLQSDELWQYLESLSLGEITVSNFSPEILLIILCLNGTKECWQSLSRICDVAELINSDRPIDWQQIIELAQQWGFKRVVCLGCLLAKNLLGTTLPDLIWQQIRADSVVQSLAKKVASCLFVSTDEIIDEVERTFFCIHTRERWQDKIKTFVSLIAFSGGINPSKNDREFLPLPRLLYFIYFLIRPFRIICKYSFFPKKLG